MRKLFFLTFWSFLLTLVPQALLANEKSALEISEDEFVKLREKRDSTLGMPRLIMPSIQVNMRAGNMPPSEDNGSTFLKVPISGIKG